ncbi:alpha/beta fold hydrolase [Streptomyces sp. GS7]|uniref:alpha/beta fold hydrolase n=1 Tax=Streptomyces sp. GS7 TaxID=2692234 RepID=UPI00131686F3|nr:alpha/beta hydrolase [Streptomyces sp. GS7]QHC23117.1 alpha/beta fold hydrolase [Streptomyces sp. GS7]
MDTDERLLALTLRDMAYACRIVPARRPCGTEPLVLIGGALQDMYSWPRLERRLTEHTTLMLMDLPGTGSAGDLASTAGFDVLADAALHAIDQLAVPRVNLLGASYGAPIAYRLAQAHPDRVARLILAGATPRVGPRLTAVVRQGLELIGADAGTGTGAPADDSARQDYARKVVDMLVNSATRHEVAQGPAVARMLERQLMRTSYSAALRHAACHERLLDVDLYPPGGIDTVRTLVFTGEHDCTSSPEENRAVAATIADAAFLLIRDADHMAHLERDAEYADLVTRFLRDRPLRDLPYCRYPDAPGRPDPQGAVSGAPQHPTHPHSQAAGPKGPQVPCG